MTCLYGEYCDCSNEDYDDLLEDNLPPNRNKQSDDDNELLF